MGGDLPTLGIDRDSTDSGKCLASCSAGYFEDAGDENKCKQCHANCATCNGPEENNCLSCTGDLPTLGIDRDSTDFGKCLDINECAVGNPCGSDSTCSNS